jgi:hypothetical protein
VGQAARLATTSRNNFLAWSAHIPYNGGVTCKHLKELYEICQAHQLKLSSTDLVRIVCRQCGIEEVCPSVLAEEYDTRHSEKTGPATPRSDSAAQAD